MECQIDRVPWLGIGLCVRDSARFYVGVRITFVERASITQSVFMKRKHRRWRIYSPDLINWCASTRNRSLKQSKGNTGSAPADGLSHPSSWKVPMVNKQDSQI